MARRAPDARSAGRHQADPRGGIWRERLLPRADPSILSAKRRRPPCSARRTPCRSTTSARPTTGRFITSWSCSRATIWIRSSPSSGPSRPRERSTCCGRRAGRSPKHEGGFIHRDIKPANIYACRYGVEYDFVKVLDFGLVKSSLESDRGSSSLTAVGTIAGTPGDMAPEVAHGNRDVDWRADIYALGCVAYWLVTGRPIFERDSAVEVLLDHASTRPVPPSEKAPGKIPPALDDVILSCLRKDPNNRPQSMSEISEALGRIEAGPSWTADRAWRWWLQNPPSRRPRVQPTDPTVPLHELDELVVPER
ncbi:MAG: serine/threonine-protein kinase [Thermoanaerobaculia bacterium]